MKHWQRHLVAVLGVVALALALIVLGRQDSLAADGTIYVDADATGLNDGSSWADAFTDLQPALDAAVSGDQIWAAAGTYTPTEEHGGSGDRYKSFQLKNGVAVYGGFDPTVGDVAFEDRDWANNETILSGDLNGDDGPEFENNDENSYHVFYHPDGTDLDSTAILDGFTISGGNADGDADHGAGGGMYNSNSSPTVTNCTFLGNQAGGGGAIDNSHSAPTLTNCTFEGNSAQWFGGGMKNTASSPILSDCTFAGNSSGYAGGGMHNGDSSSPALTNCTFEENSAVNQGGGMSNWGSSPALTNCSFSSNTSGSGGGMYNEGSSPTLANCSFSGNSAGDGGGMANYSSSSSTLTNCTFEGNSADLGGGMRNLGSSLTLTGCSFIGNSADNCGGLDNTDSSPTLANCTFSGNSAGNGGGMCNFSLGQATLTNCTFVGNSAEYEGGAIYNNSSGPTLTNCILWGDTPNEIVGGWPTVAYSDIQGGYDGQGNMDADPMFVDRVNINFRLRADSPCIDTGDNAAPGLPAHDFEGNDRILDGDGDGTAIVDMGVDEARWPLFVDADATSGANNGSSWQDAFTALQPALDVATAGDQILVAEATYTPTEEHGGSGDRYKSFQLKNGVALFGGFDPSVGDTGFEDRDWGNNLIILSGDLNGDDGPDFESNDENSYHVFYHPDGTDLDSSAVLDGFTLSGGNANGASYPDTAGGAMFNYGSSPALSNCTFEGNWANFGGGMYNEDSSSTLNGCHFSGNSAGAAGGGIYNWLASPALTDCTFADNWALYAGGGIFNYSSSPTLANCTFSGNSAIYDGGGMANGSDSSPVLTNCTFSDNSASDTGGGMYNDGATPTLTNCTFSGNSADNGGGGMYSYGSSAALTNCILWGNTPDQISDEDSSWVVTYSDIQGGFLGGEGNIDEDPLFVSPDSGDYHLGPGSLCIDAGDNDAPFLPEQDYEGDARIVDGDGDGEPVVDMGVDEVRVRVYLPLVLKGY